MALVSPDAKPSTDGYVAAVPDKRRTTAEAERYLSPVADQQTIRDQVQKHWDALKSHDDDAAHEVYHPDAVLEFPQSGERFEGVDSFHEWRKQYPAEVDYRIRRMTIDGNLAGVECSVSYNGGPWQFGIQILEFRGERISRERIYVTEGWEPPEWRGPWRAERPRD